MTVERKGVIVGMIKIYEIGVILGMIKINKTVAQKEDERYFFPAPYDRVCL